MVDASWTSRSHEVPDTASAERMAAGKAFLLLEHLLPIIAALMISRVYSR